MFVEARVPVEDDRVPVDAVPVVALAERLPEATALRVTEPDLAEPDSARVPRLLTPERVPKLLALRVEPVAAAPRLLPER